MDLISIKTNSNDFYCKAIKLFSLLFLLSYHILVSCLSEKVFCPIQLIEAGHQNDALTFYSSDHQREGLLALSNSFGDKGKIK